MSETEPVLSSEELDQLSFEEAQARLEAVVAELEGGQLSLERAVALYEFGLRLRDHCRAKLAAAEQAIERLLSAEAG